MSKMSTDTSVKLTLSGPTMGARWSAVFHGEPLGWHDDLRSALQASVDEVDEWFAGRVEKLKEEAERKRLGHRSAATGQGQRPSPAHMKSLTKAARRAATLRAG